MSELFLGYFAYWFIIALMILGFYGMVLKRNLVKKLIGMTIMQASIIMLFVALAAKDGATVPINENGADQPDPAHYINPLPHTLMLTAIVVGAATVGVAFSLLISIYRDYETLDESELLDRMR